MMSAMVISTYALQQWIYKMIRSRWNFTQSKERLILYLLLVRLKFFRLRLKYDKQTTDNNNLSCSVLCKCFRWASSRAGMDKSKWATWALWKYRHFTLVIVFKCRRFTASIRSMPESTDGYSGHPKWFCFSYTYLLSLYGSVRYRTEY